MPRDEVLDIYDRGFGVDRQSQEPKPSAKAPSTKPPSDKGPNDKFPKSVRKSPEPKPTESQNWRNGLPEKLRHVKNLPPNLVKILEAAESATSYTDHPEIGRFAQEILSLKDRAVIETIRAGQPYPSTVSGFSRVNDTFNNELQLLRIARRK